MSLIVGILASVVVLILIYEPTSLLQKRFVKTSAKQEKLLVKVMLNLQELLGPLSRRNSKTANYMGKTKDLLLQAGYASTEDDIIKFDSRNLANTFIAMLLCVLYLFVSFSAMGVIACIIFLYLVYKWPEVKLKSVIKARQKEFIKYLPDAVDLLSICVQAGLGIDSAFAKVADEFELTSKIISVEFNRLNKDILSGLNRQDSYKNLLLRNKNQDLQSFVALLIQTDKLGTSISQSLEAFCDTMRTRKRQRIEELSQQASTKMTIPMVLFMLPAIFIIIMFPAMQKIMINLGH